MELDSEEPAQMHDIMMRDDTEGVFLTENHSVDTGAPLSQLSLQQTSGPQLREPSLALKGTDVRQDMDIPDSQLQRLRDGPRPAKFNALPYATSQTGLVYDVRMRFHVEVTPSEDELHPEDPRRIHAIFESFVEAGLVWTQDGPAPAIDFYMGRIETRHVTKPEVCLVHTEAHWDWVQQLKYKTADELVDELQHPPHGMDSVYMSPSTPLCAALSAGGAIEACRAVLLGKVKNAFAVIRPPGHHAEREDAKGFCFFDNVSIATKVCQREFGDDCRKVFILDWDVHHGNGIQQANYDDANVLYVSLHVHERGRFYPEMSYRDKRPPYGDHLHCGEGAGLGKNVNVPWSKKGMGDADYIYAFQQVIMPIATEFNPDLVIIAAGFDAAEGDMLGGCKVTPAGYAHMTHMLMSLANGKLVVCLEGGYNLESIARSATAVAKTMMGEAPDKLAETNPSISGVEDVKLVLRQQSRFWTSLYPKDISERLAGELQGERMHHIVRRYQASTLWEKYEMAPLFVHRDSLSKSFENQVLATPTYIEARPLLVILHDPPEVIASPDPRTGKIELHNTWLTDIVKTYVDWAVTQGFAVIDVNLPRYTTDIVDSQEHEEMDAVVERTKEATELVTYLWENYIELGEATHIFLMGTNTGHGAILNFIKANEERAQELLTGAISFVEDVPLQSCKSQTNDGLALWYYPRSLLFVKAEHHYWSSDLSRKPKKRFGRVNPSEEDSITDMLLAHKDSVFDMLLRETEDWRATHKPGDVARDGLLEPFESPKPLPPIANFALSPRAAGRAGAGVLGNSFGSPRAGSPHKLLPVDGSMPF